MAFTGALAAAGARFSEPDGLKCGSYSQLVSAQRARDHSRVSLCRNGAVRRYGALLFAVPRKDGDGLSFGRERFRVLAQSRAEMEQQDSGSKSTVDPETGIDADGYVTAALPKEFLELMEDEGDPPNYRLMGFALVVAVLARKVIWSELRRWGDLAVFSGLFVVDLVIAAYSKLLIVGGEPLLSVITAVACVGLTIVNCLRVLGDAIPIRAVSFAIFLSTIVLLVGESVSETYSTAPNSFPSRNVLDISGLLGLAGMLGILSQEVFLLSLIAVTTFLLGVKKLNPVAGFTPAVAALVAVSGPRIRYPVLATFVGSAVFRYWKMGYLSQGAVMGRRKGEYPRVLVALVYLVAISMVCKVIFAVEAIFF